MNQSSPYFEPVEYFFYCRDRPGTAALRDELVEAHWSFMDRYADAMIARGPTLTPDGTTATGSMHIVDLPDARAAHVFAFEEPNYRAGVYGEVLVRRWKNALGGTMWVGSAMLVELRDRAAVEAMLAEAPYAQAGVYAGVEIHHWEFGGRRSA